MRPTQEIERIFEASGLIKPSPEELPPKRIWTESRDRDLRFDLEDGFHVCKRPDCCGTFSIQLKESYTYAEVDAMWADWVQKKLKQGAWRLAVSISSQKDEQMAEEKGCNCVEKSRAKLAEHNTRIVQRLTMTGVMPNVSILVERIETGRGKPKAMAVIASYCPFCGKKYPGVEKFTASTEKAKKK